MDSKETQGCPMHAVVEGELTYNDYLKVSELLKLQVPQSAPAHHDELLFIIIHQAYELWFKLILHEMQSSIRSMEEEKILRAHHFMNRAVQIMRLLVQQIHILETMSPVEFLGFRDSLMPASGFQSIQFREIEYLAGLKDEHYLRYFKNRPDFLAILNRRLKEPDLKSAYFHLLRKLGFSMPQEDADYEGIIRGILPIYQHPDQHLPLHLLSETLIEFDEYLGLWREHHIRAVERVIGAKPGTGGSQGVAYLRTTTSKKCFPFLWDVRNYLVKE